MSRSIFPLLRNIIYHAAILFILSLPIGGWKLVTELYHEIFSLGINDTVEDYTKSPIEQVVRLHMNGFCNNGTCITKSDWVCGFITETWKFDHDEFSSYSEALDDCVRKLIRTFAKEAKLEKIAIICGRHYMTFDPRSTGATPEHCEKAGGVWGVKTPLWADDEYLLTVAGVHN